MSDIKKLERLETFWRLCLKVARSKPHLSAEAVEYEATLIMCGLEPERKE